MLIPLTFYFELISNAKYISIDNSNDISSTVSAISKCLPAYVTTDNTEVTNSLLTRIDSSPIAIPNSIIALLHTRSSYVSTPYFSVVDINTPISMQSMDGKTTNVSRFIFMVGPNNMSKGQQEALSLISSSIIINDSTLKTFETAPLSKIKNILAKNCLTQLKRQFTNTPY